MPRRPGRPGRLPPYCCEDRDDRGNVRVYLRRPGHQKVRLRGMAWTPDFMAQYERLLNVTTAPAQVSVSKRETWRWLCEQYLASPEFGNLASSTRTAYRRILESTWDEPIAPETPNLIFADMPIHKMTPEAVRVLRNRKKDNPFAADGRVKKISHVFAWGLENLSAIVKDNPTLKVKRFNAGTDGHHPWTEDEFGQFMDRYPGGSKERRAMALLFYTGARGCDARLFGPQHVKGGRFAFTQQKTGGLVDVRVMEELARELALAPREALAFILTEYGKTFSQKGFSQWFNQKARDAGLVNCTTHGVRKGAATIAAENGATIHELMALFGWMTEGMAILYTKTVNRKRLADAASKHLKIGGRTA